MTTLGLSKYNSKRSVSANKEAVDLLEKASQLGYPGAQKALAEIYQREGANASKALYWIYVLNEEGYSLFEKEKEILEKNLTEPQRAQLQSDAKKLKTRGTGSTLEN